MTALLVFLLVFFGLGWVLSRTWPYIIMWMLKRQLGKQARQQQYAEQQFRRRPQQPPRKARRTKIFSRTDGEYVEFEELPGKPEPPTDPQRKYPTEPQVTDAEWEDL